MAYYPIFLELKKRPCLVIGGGGVAYRKVVALLSCGACVKVVSPELVVGLRRLVQQGNVRWARHPFRTSDLNGVELVVAATDEPTVNSDAYRWATQKRIWINVVDQPKLCSFIVPSVVRRGKLVLGISTGGASPALSKWIRRDLEARYGPEFGQLLNGMGKARPEVQQRVKSGAKRKKLFEEALKAYFGALKLRPSTKPALSLSKGSGRTER